MTALIVAPTLVAVLLAGIRVVGSIDSLSGYQQVRQSAEYSVRLRDLTQQLGLERDITAWGSPKSKINIDGKHQLTRAQQRAAVDGLVGGVTADLKEIDSSFGVRASQDAKQALTSLEGLADIRSQASVDSYDNLIATLLRLHDELGQNSDDPEVVGDARALSALAHAKEEASQQREMLTQELRERNQTFLSFEVKDFIASQSRQQADVDDFITEVDPAEGKKLGTLLADQDVVDAELTKGWAITLATQNSTLNGYRGRGQILTRWFQHSTKAINQMVIVEHEVSASVLDRARQLQSTEQRNVLITGGLILALLLLVLATTVLIARSMVRPLRRLRAEALEIAGLRLPDMVRRMRESDEVGKEPQVRPIAVGTQDEIGEVAQAFDEVHRQAVRLAAEESRLRANVNSMFVNLSRRTQTLVERQIALIDGLERGEEDGQRLSDLFKLDHLATRMRRNSENLLVLAGHEPARKRSQPARLVDVVRASLSEIEDYERVSVKVHRSIAIAGHAANDVVHLVAELVENAIAFSPRNTRVIVSSSPVEGGAVMLGVSDAGIGMTPEELVDINQRLAEPPTVDVSVSRRMGLFVVGRLALRHGIRVQLRKGDQSGMIAMVLFPAEMISNADQVATARPDPVGVGIGSGTFGDQPSRGGATATGGFQPWGAPTANEGPGSFSPWEPPTTPPPPNGLPTRRSALSRDGGATAPTVGASAGALSDAGTGVFSPFGAPSAPSMPPSPPAAPASPVSPGETTASFPPIRDVPGGLPPAAPPTGRPTFTEHSGAFPIAEPGAATGPLPAVEDAPLERGDEYLPIFASVESAWFRRPTTGTPPPPSRPEQDAAAAVPGTGTGPLGTPAPAGRTEATPPQGTWWSRADSGFEKAAGIAKDPSQGGVTSAGLPKRTPKANLVPGSVGAETPSVAPRPPVSADEVRNRLSSLQKGVRRGRADLAGGSAEGSRNEEEGS
ncbi:nitrate- and nitrite sensing domain-containing protein [Planotetraspora thailandica]|uniref:sensor histidine kinase n=1 Tax=Planotetraspora thailandica TaxID=487172 RepID=UPI0019522C1A|nr:nitrate- and nitrite sensing domain-containing protein [Planotetraspora thailandica]